MNGIKVEREKVFKSANKADASKEYVKHNGTGYVNIARLGEVYNKILRVNAFDGKFKDYEKFKEIFSERFGENADDISKQLTTLKGKDDVYESYKTALRIFKKDRDISYSKNEFDLYDYLSKSADIKKSFPIRDSASKAFTGNINIDSPEELNIAFMEMDKEIAIKYLRPDLQGEQTEPDKIAEKKQFLTVISTLRDNIDGLTAEDIEKVTYGEIQSYAHNNMECLVVSAGDKQYMTFSREDAYLGSGEFAELSKERTGQILGDGKNTRGASVSTTRNIWSVVKDDKGFVPLTDNPNMEHIELSNERYLDGEIVEKEPDGKDGTSVGLSQTQVKYFDDEEQQEDRVEKVEEQKPRTSNSFRTSINRLQQEETQKSDSHKDLEVSKPKNEISRSFKQSLQMQRNTFRVGREDVRGEQTAIAVEQQQLRQKQTKSYGMSL